MGRAGNSGDAARAAGSHGTGDPSRPFRARPCAGSRDRTFYRPAAAGSGANATDDISCHRADSRDPAACHRTGSRTSAAHGGSTACNPADARFPASACPGIPVPGAARNTAASTSRNRSGICLHLPGCRQRCPGSHISSPRGARGGPETLEFLQPHLPKDPGV